MFKWTASRFVLMQICGFLVYLTTFGCDERPTRPTATTVSVEVKEEKKVTFEVIHGPVGSTAGSDATPRAFDAAAQWTSDAIAADPEGYLEWAVRHLDELETDIKARRIGCRIQQNACLREREWTRKLHDDTVEKLRHLKLAYRNASQSETWPIVVSGLEELEGPLTRREAHVLLIDANRKSKSRSAKLVECDRLLLDLRSRLKDVDNIAEYIKETRSEAIQKREGLRLRRQILDLMSVREDIASIADRVGVLGEPRAIRSDIDGVSLNPEIVSRGEEEREVAQILAAE
jgi:hypothetical protein